MNKKLFSNEITINATKEKILEVLRKPEKPLKLIPDIVSIDTISSSQFKITRNDPALNIFEVITINSNNDEIIFESTEGRFTYNLVFKVISSNKQTVLTETLVSTTETKLPINLFSPIAKHAFKENLSILKYYIELM